MFAPGQVEEMLRAHEGAYCSIQLFREVDGQGWQAAVNHYDARKMLPAETVVRSDVDPVVALGKALTEDQRRLKDVARKFAAAPKVSAQIDIEEAIAAIAAATVTDVMELLG